MIRDNSQRERVQTHPEFTIMATSGPSRPIDNGSNRPSRNLGKLNSTKITGEMLALA
jgi:hypothetical protein